jgi:eukaryotic-like serine/threonine-protein kinase
VYSATGHILYRRQPVNRGIWALPFSLARHEKTGEPFLVAPEGDTPSVSNDGTLVHSIGTATRQTQMVWVDRSGKVLAKVGQPQEHWPFPCLSPDERMVAIAASEGEEHEVWIHDVERGTKTRLTFGMKAGYAAPTWTADGKGVLVDGGSGGNAFTTHLISSDGRTVGDELAKGWSSSLSPDGRYLVFTKDAGSSDADIWYLDLTSKGEPAPLIKAQGVQLWPRVSPDGQYVAYVSGETGSDEVYVKRFPSGEGKWQVSISGGYWPKWSPRGDRLYYVVGEAIMEVDVSAKPSFSLGKPREVLKRQPLGWPILFGWPPGFDVSKDGQRFLVLQAEGGQKSATGFVVVESWFSEFRR